MKLNLFCLFLTAALFPFRDARGQNKNLVIGSAIMADYDKLGAVKGSAGIIGDHYYVLENDFGGGFDFNNNIRTSVSIVSIKTGRLVKRFSLNEMLAQSKKELNKILLCNVITWKDQLIGFYTYKNPSGKTFAAHAIILDPEGKPLQTNRKVADFDHGFTAGSFLGQGGLIVNGRNTLSVVKDFQFRFTPDSSKMVVLAAHNEKAGNISFNVYKPGLELEKEVTAALPLETKTADLVEFTVDKYGMIYLLTRNKADKGEGEYSFQLHSINTQQNNEVKSLRLTVPGKFIRNANIGLTASGVPMVVGFYNSAASKKNPEHIHGAYSIRINTAAWTSPTVNYRDLPEQVLVDRIGEKAVKKGEGLEEQIRIYKFLPNGNGLYAFGRYDYVLVTTRGTTGALNTYREVTKCPISYAIDESGKILWEGFYSYTSINGELRTRADRVEYVAKPDETVGFYVGKVGEKDPLSLCALVSNRSGVNLKPALTYSAGTESIVENTVFRISDNEYVALMYGGESPKEKDFYRLVRFSY